MVKWLEIAHDTVRARSILERLERVTGEAAANFRDIAPKIAWWNGGLEANKWDLARLSVWHRVWYNRHAWLTAEEQVARSRFDQLDLQARRHFFSVRALNAVSNAVSRDL